MIRFNCLKWQDIDASHMAAMTRLRDAHVRYDNPFFDPQFAAIVASVRGDVCVITAHRDTELVGFWPLHRRPDGWARPIGGPFSDWHGPVVAESIAELSPTSFLQGAGLRGLTAHGLQVSDSCEIGGLEIQGSGVACVPGKASDYLAIQQELYTKHTKNLRRAVRLIDKDFGGMTVTLDDRSDAAFDWLMAQKSQQFDATGKHNVLAPDWVGNMMQALRARTGPGLRGRLSTLRLDGKIAAAEFNLLSERVIHGWIVAYDPAMARYSVGHLMLQAIICGMEESGHTAYDLGPGNTAYKKYYESYQLPVGSVSLHTRVGGRVMPAAWRYAETHAPARISGLMQKMRRRGDQIFGAELDTSGRLKGLFAALSGADSSH